MLEIQPTFYELISGDRESGVSIMNQIADEIDIFIEDEDTPTDLQHEFIDFIIPMLLESLSVQSDTTTLSLESQSVDEIGGALIADLRQYSNRVIELVVPFIERNIVSTEWRLLDAALHALGSVLSPSSTTPIESDNSICDLACQSLPFLIKICCEHPSSRVRFQCSTTLRCLLLSLPSGPTRSMVDELASAFLTGLSDLDEGVVSQSSIGLYYLAESTTENTELQSTGLGDLSSQILAKLFELTDCDETTYYYKQLLIQSSNFYTTVEAVINSNSGGCAIQDLNGIITESLRRLSQYLHFPKDIRDTLAPSLLSVLCAATTTAITKKNSSNSDLLLLTIDEVVECGIIFTENNDESEGRDEAMLLLSSLIDSLPEEAAQRFFPRIISAVTLGTECRLSLSLLGDIGRTGSVAMQAVLPALIPQVLHTMQTTQNRYFKSPPGRGVFLLLLFLLSNCENTPLFLSLSLSSLSSLPFKFLYILS